MEIAVILVFALLFVGPQKLPQLAKQMGKFFVHAKRMTGDVRTTIDGYMREAEAEIIAEERDKIKKLIETEIANSPEEPQHQEEDPEWVNPEHAHESEPGEGNPEFVKVEDVAPADSQTPEGATPTDPSKENPADNAWQDSSSNEDTKK